MTKDKESNGLGVVADEGIPPLGMKKIVLGPFRLDEVPRLRTLYENDEAKKWLVCEKARLDVTGGYKLIYLVQNYGMKTVRVAIRRMR